MWAGVNAALNRRSWSYMPRMAETVSRLESTQAVRALPDARPTPTPGRVSERQGLRGAAKRSLRRLARSRLGTGRWALTQRFVMEHGDMRTLRSGEANENATWTFWTLLNRSLGTLVHRHRGGRGQARYWPHRMTFRRDQPPTLHLT